MQFKHLRRHWIVAGAFVAFIGGMRATASTTTLAWDPPTHNTDGTQITNLAGYVVYYGTQSGSYDQSIDVGNVASVELTGLTDGQNYYATVRAYNTYDLESGSPPEFTWTAPDTIAPTIGLPSQISLTGDENDQAPVPDLVAQATVSDNVSQAINISLSQAPLAGVLIRLGTTPVTLTAEDEAGNVAQATVDVVVVAMNRPPNVNAGLDQATRLPQAHVTLEGMIDDDGLPAGSTVSVAWTLVTGPAPVTFAAAASLATRVDFTQEGTYVIRLSATDGELTASDEVTITVNPKPVPMPPSNFRAMPQR